MITGLYGVAKNKIAMVTLSLNAYSETFIQAQKKGLKGEVFYYYGVFYQLIWKNYGRLINCLLLCFIKAKRKLNLKSIKRKAYLFIR
jgi:hypothetical protein